VTNEDDAIEVLRARLAGAEAERDTALRFAFTPEWAWVEDMPHPYRDDAHVAYRALRKQIRAAFEAAPSLDELLRRQP